MWRFVGGDDGAFADVYRRAAPRVYGMLVRLCRDPALAEDLTQDTFFRMHRARGAYRKGAEVLPWAYTIGRRLFIDVKRHRRHESSNSSSDDAERADGHAIDAASPADEELSARRMARAVEQALAGLPRRQAEAFMLVKGEGLSIAEAADRVGETGMTMRLRAHRATQAIRHLLESQWELSTSACCARARTHRRPSARQSLS